MQLTTSFFLLNGAVTGNDKNIKFLSKFFFTYWTACFQDSISGELFLVSFFGLKITVKAGGEGDFTLNGSAVNVGAGVFADVPGTA